MFDVHELPPRCQNCDVLKELLTEPDTICAPLVHCLEALSFSENILSLTEEEKHTFMGQIYDEGVALRRQAQYNAAVGLDTAWVRCTGKPCVLKVLQAPESA